MRVPVIAMLRRVLFSLCCLALTDGAHAQTFSQSGSATLGVRVVIATLCSVGATSTGTATASFGKLDFGSHPSLANRLTGQRGADIRVQCATGVPYRVVLGAGENDTGTQRRLKGPGGAFVPYVLFGDASLSQPLTASAPVARLGTGAEETIPVYAAINPQATPAAGLYRDTVKVTIQW